MQAHIYTYVHYTCTHVYTCIETHSDTHIHTHAHVSHLKSGPGPRAALEKENLALPGAAALGRSPTCYSFSF